MSSAPLTQAGAEFDASQQVEAHQALWAELALQVDRIAAADRLDGRQALEILTGRQTPETR